MLTERTRIALAAALYDAGFTAVARLIAEGTSDVYEVFADEPLKDAEPAIVLARNAARHTGAAQLVLVTPDGEGVWKRPELLGVVESVPDSAPDVLGIMRDTLERAR